MYACCHSGCLPRPNRVFSRAAMTCATSYGSRSLCSGLSQKPASSPDLEIVVRAVRVSLHERTKDRRSACQMR